MSRKNKGRKPQAQETPQVATELEEQTADGQEQEVEVNEPGDCIGHWDACKECDMCEIWESCKAMTGEINGDEDEGE